MDSVFERKHWNERYAKGGHSGAGSYGEQMAKKVAIISQLQYQTITEVGCGDFNLGKTLLELHPAKYTGLDISDFIIHKNQVLYPEHTWFVMADTYIPPADLVLCIDVLFHVIEDQDLEDLLAMLEKVKCEYLVITAYEHFVEKSNHVRIREFDYKRFGTPMVRQLIDEREQLYLYVYKYDRPHPSVSVPDNEGPTVPARDSG